MPTRGRLHALIVDDDPDFRALARRFLERSLPRLRVDEFDPTGGVLPEPDFPWAKYQVMLLDQDFSRTIGDKPRAATWMSGEAPVNEFTDGLTWLTRYAARKDFPPVVFVTAAGDEYVAARASKLGANHYLSKRDVTADRLCDAVISAISDRSAQLERSAGSSERASSGFAGEQTDCQRMVPGYLISQQIAAGSTAEVYRVERLRDGLNAVLKLIRADVVHDRASLTLFEREAEVVRQVCDPRVIRVLDHGVTGARPFLVLEYLPFGDLRDWEAATARSAAVSEAMVDILLGLAAVHDAGVVHRDIKPANLMFRIDGTLAVADFGIARGVIGSAFARDDGTPAVVGTPHYMSPEACSGQVIDARADLYSAGIVFYELLTGFRPFGARSLGALFEKHISASVPDLPAHVGHYQPLLDRLLAKDPGARYQSAADALEALAGIDVELSATV